MNGNQKSLFSDGQFNVSSSFAAKENQSELLNKYIVLSEVISFLMLGILFIRGNKIYSGIVSLDITTVFIVAVAFSAIPLLQYVHPKLLGKSSGWDFAIATIYIVVVACLLYKETDKLLYVTLLMPVILISVKYDTRTSLCFAGFSVMILLLLSSKNGTTYYDAELVFGGLAFLTAWLLGTIAKTERDVRTELMLSEEKFREVFNNANDMIVLYKGIERGARRIVEVNKTMCIRSGYTREELLGKDLLQLIAEPEQEKISTLNEQILKDGSVSWETLLKTKDGREIPVEKSSHIFKFRQQTLVITIIRDITERRRMEEELLKTSKLESLGLLADGIAHDFNNILFIIKGNASLAKFLSKGNVNICEKLENIEKAVNQAQNLTQQLMTFAKGGLTVKTVVQIEPILREAVQLSLRGSNVKCEFYIDDDLYPVEVDEGQISQVINNLVINASQAMPNGGTIKVRARNFIIESEAQDRKCVEISIEDEGMGIPEKYLTKIFDPYFTTKPTGTGLGLATSYSIIKKHNGQIKVDSKPGKGTTFYIYLPTALKKPKKINEADKATIMGNSRILVMDDDIMILNLLKEMLESLGYEVACTACGEEALKKYSQARESNKPFDAVIMDLTVPGGMGGVETMKHLLKIDPHVKGIVSSGYSNSTTSDFKKYGFKAVIPKPYDMQKLSSIVDEVVKGDM